MTEPELDPDNEQERLDDLGKRIAQTRHETDERDPAKEDERTFAESGTIHPEADDQTSAPG